MTLEHFRSAHGIVDLIRRKQISPVAVMEETLRRIEKVNPVLNAFVALRAEEAMEEAKSIEKRIASGEDPGPLAGVPIGVKDLEDVQGLVTSFGSIPYRNNVAKQDSAQVARLKAAGAIVVGKTNTPEFGFTGFTKNLLFGVTRNPWNPERTPGGSSGGSASAVASGMVPVATGSDAGGSIRIPASYSGCFGLKPSFGRIPYGPTPLLQIYDMLTLGPLTRTAKDAALYLDCAAGSHPCDPGSLPSPEGSYVKRLEARLSKLHIAFSPTLGYAKVQKEVMERVEKAVKVFEEAGHEVELWSGSLPDVSRAWTTFTNCELYGMLHRSIVRNRSEMGKTLVETVEQVESLPFMDLIEAQRARTELNRALWKLFEAFDLLMTPGMPTEAFAAKGPPPSEIDGQPIPLLGVTPFTYPFNLSGHPAASVCAGLTDHRLPVGLQIVGPRYRDDRVLQAAYEYEQMRPWNDGWPQIG